MKQQIGLWLSAMAALWPARASADESAGPAAAHVPVTSYYMATHASTTIAVRSSMGPMSGPQRDASIGIGVGRTLRQSLFVQLDGCASWIDSADTAISFMPAIGWAFHPSFYAAMRTRVPVQGPFDITLAPGVGAQHALDDTIDVFAEVNLERAFASDNHDVGVALTLGATVGL